MGTCPISETENRIITVVTRIGLYLLFEPVETLVFSRFPSFRLLSLQHRGVNFPCRNSILMHRLSYFKDTDFSRFFNIILRISVLTFANYGLINIGIKYEFIDSPCIIYTFVSSDLCNCEYDSVTDFRFERNLLQF